MAGGSAWSEEQPRAPRPYTATGGRTEAAHQLRRETLVQAQPREHPASGLGPQAARALTLCQQPRPIAEIAARLGLPVQVVKILISDLITSGDVRLTVPRRQTVDPRDPQILEAVLAGLHQIRSRSA